MPVTLPATPQPFLKSSERPQTVQGGEALNPMTVVYKKSTDEKWYKADSDPADAEKYTNVKLTVNWTETNQYVCVVSQKGTIADFGVTFSPDVVYYLLGTGQIGTYSEVASADRLVQVGIGNEDDDLIVNILDTGKFKP